MNKKQTEDLMKIKYPSFTIVPGMKRVSKGTKKHACYICHLMLTVGLYDVVDGYLLTKRPAPKKLLEEHHPACAFRIKYSSEYKICVVCKEPWIEGHLCYLMKAISTLNNNIGEIARVVNIIQTNVDILTRSINK